MVYIFFFQKNYQIFTFVLSKLGFVFNILRCFLLVFLKRKDVLKPSIYYTTPVSKTEDELIIYDP